jgi:DNA-binding NarL/FixJ family response regulator
VTTTSEFDVLREMAQGKNNAGCRRRLTPVGIGRGEHVSSIFLKLGVHEDSQISRRVTAS